MADPTKYLPAYSYSNWQATNPKKPLPADEVDNDFANVSRSINQTIDGLKDIRRSDGALKNGIVGPDTLSPSLSLGFTLRGLWAEGEAYSAGDGVVHDNVFYAARVTHIASPENAPGNASFWNYLFSVDDLAVVGALSMPRVAFVGDGTVGPFGLTFAPSSRLNLLVSIGGVLQSANSYEIDGSTIVFTEPPPLGYEIEVRGFATTAVLLDPADGSVSFDKLTSTLQSTFSKADTQLQSRADAVAKLHPQTAPVYIETAGYAAPGDRGGAVYKMVVSEPSHAAKFSITTLLGATVWYEFAGDEITLFQMGAKGDATPYTTGSGTDDTAAWNNTAAVAVALRIPMKIPSLAVNKAFRLTSTAVYPEALTIKGDGVDITVGLTANYPNGGAWLYFDHLDEGFYFRDDANVGASKKFARLKGFGVVRNQAAPGPGWVPTAADHDLRVEYNVDMEDMVFLSSSKIALIRSAGQLQTRRVRGQPLIVGYECERSSDVQRWDGDHWWPYWSQDSNVRDYTTANTLGYKVRRADGLMITHPFSIWYKRLFYAEDAAGDGSGLANFHLINPYADIGGGGIEIVSENYAAYGSITGYLCNSSIDGAPSEGAAFRLRGAVASQINLEMRSNRSPEEVVHVSGAAHRVRLNAGRLNGWAFVSSGRYAIKATNGAVIDMLTEPEFAAGNNGLLYSPDATSRIILPVKFDIGKSATSGAGYFSRRLTIADDAFVTIDAPSSDKTCNLHITPISAPANGNPAGSVWGRATASPSALVISLSHTTNVAVATGVLTGTTGTDGNLTISFANDGKIYVENRTGASKSFIFTLLGN